MIDQFWEQKTYKPELIDPDGIFHKNIAEYPASLWALKSLLQKGKHLQLNEAERFGKKREYAKKNYGNGFMKFLAGMCTHPLKLEMAELKWDFLVTRNKLKASLTPLKKQRFTIESSY